ncbi:MAG: hypothetical protein ACRDIL_00260, partial [Candidatus Limnocylindrales bacterium]
FGLQDRFEEFCDELSGRYGLELTGPIRSNRTEPTTVPDGLADRIAGDNALDMELYGFAQGLYEERHPRTEPATPPDRGSVQAPGTHRPSVGTREADG